MMGLAEILEPKPKVQVPVEIANPGEPPDLDRNGLDEPLGSSGDRLKGPPLDEVKARAHAKRTVKRRR
jgi:hypothetical protein